MKVAVVKNGKFQIEEKPTPQLDEYGSGAIIKVEGCGLCGSDIVKIRNGLVPNGTVLGHEVIGEIVDIKSNTPFRAGDRVVLGHHVPCFYCRYCLGGSYSMCRHFKETNIFPGGFSEYIYVSEEHLNNTVFYANLGLSSIEASFIEPLACCIRAVKRAQLADNSRVLIIGLGSIGILMGQSLKVYGHKVYGCDVIAQRADFSLKYGFDKSFVLNKDDTSEALKEVEPIGFDAVFLTAGADSSLDFAVNQSRDGAKIIVFSSIKSDNAFKNNDIYYRELSIIGSYSSTPVDLEDSIKFIEERKVNVEGISSVYKLEDINNALSDTVSNKIMKAYLKI